MILRYRNAIPRGNYGEITKANADWLTRLGGSATLLEFFPLARRDPFSWSRLCL